MGQPVARQGDLIVTACQHLVKGQPPGTAPPVAAQLPHLFDATFQQNLSTTVKIEGKFVALKGSTGQDQVHVPLPPPGTTSLGFLQEPSKQAEIIGGSSSVNIQGKPVARIGDPVKTCSEVPPPHGTVGPAPGTPTTVFVGG